jgi:hypothetical protein
MPYCCLSAYRPGRSCPLCRCLGRLHQPGAGLLPIRGSSTSQTLTQRARRKISTRPAAQRSARSPNLKAQASMFKQSAKRFGFASAAIIMALTLLSAAAQAKLPQPIYFWSNIPEPVSGGFMPNPLVARPSTFLLFEDGQWVLQDMHWTGWGSSVAHATGISNSSSGMPSAEGGKRIKTWARVTLSDPGSFQGHEVYRCFDLAVPPPATLGPRPSCLAHSGSLWLLTEGAPPPRSLQELEFRRGGAR